MMSPEWIGVVGIILLLVLFMSGMSVGLALLLVGFIGMVILTDVPIGLSQLGSIVFETTNVYDLSVIPLFTLMGMLMSHTGLGQELYNAVDKWVGHFRGGLAIATIGASSIFSAIAGTTTATTATLSKIAVPEMQKHHYNNSLATASVAAGGTLGILIPPSVILILYGTLTNEPIGPLLIAGIVPGVLMAVVFMLIVYIQVRLKPDLAPTKPNSSTLFEKVLSLSTIWPFAVVFLLSIGGIYFGFFTPTEAAGIGAFGSFILVLVLKRLTWRKWSETLDETIRLTAMIFLILCGAGLFSKFIALSNIPLNLSRYISSLDVSEYTILAFILLAYIIMGMFMDGIAMLVLSLPIVYPLITELGFDGIWFGVIVVMMINIGFLSPPLGISVFIINGVVKDVPIEEIFKGVIPMMLGMLLFAVLLIIFPQIVTFLPSFVK